MYLCSINKPIYVALGRYFVKFVYRRSGKVSVQPWAGHSLLPWRTTVISVSSKLFRYIRDMGLKLVIATAELPLARPQRYPTAQSLILARA
jgi:hypothetical protein